MLERRPRLRPLAGGGGQVGQRREGQPEVGHERDHGAHRHRAVGRLRAGDGHHHRDEQHPRAERSRLEGHDRALSLPGQGALAPVELVEAPPVALLLGERAHGADADDGLLEYGDLLRRRLARPAQGLARPALEQRAEHGEDGDDRQHDERELGVDGEQHDEGAGDGQRARNQERHATDHERIERGQVVGQARDQGAGAGAVKEADGQALQVREDALAQVAQEELADLADEPGLGVGRAPEHEHAEPERDAELVQVRRGVALEHVVDGLPGQVRRGQAGHGGDEHGDERRPGPHALFAQHRRHAGEGAAGLARSAGERGVVGRVLSTVCGNRRGLLRRRCRAPLRLEFVHLGDRGQAPIALVSGQQLAMGAAGGDDAALEHGHLVGGGDRGRAVADHERGPVRRRAPQRGQQRRLGAGVEVAGDVVERQHPRLDQQRPRDGHALALAARQRDAGLAHLGVQAVVHGVQRPRELGRRCGRLHLGVGGVAAAVGDVVPDGPVDQEALAVGDRNGLPQGVQAHRAHVGARDLDAPAIDVVEPVDQRDHRRLPRAGRSDDGERAPVRHREIDVAECRRRAWVGEPDVAQDG